MKSSDLYNLLRRHGARTGDVINCLIDGERVNLIVQIHAFDNYMSLYDTTDPAHAYAITDNPDLSRDLPITDAWLHREEATRDPEHWMWDPEPVEGVIPLAPQKEEVPFLDLEWKRVSAFARAIAAKDLAPQKEEPPTNPTEASRSLVDTPEVGFGNIGREISEAEKERQVAAFMREIDIPPRTDLASRIDRLTGKLDGATQMLRDRIEARDRQVESLVRRMDELADRLDLVEMFNKEFTDAVELRDLVAELTERVERLEKVEVKRWGGRFEALELAKRLKRKLADDEEWRKMQNEKIGGTDER